VIYDIFDFYADHLRSTPQWIKKIVRFAETRCIDWVDGVILVDEVRLEQISGSNPKRQIVVYNTPQDVSQQLGERVDKENERKFSIVYVGLLQAERGIQEVVEVMKRHPEWTLDLAGFGGDEDSLREVADGVGNVRCLGRISYSCALELSSKADVLFATYDPAIPNHRYASPNKVFEAMMLGVPILVARGTNVDMIVEKHKCGLVVDFGDVDQLDTALTTLGDTPELRSWLGSNGRCENVYSWDKMESRLLDFYSSISSSDQYA